MGPDRDRTRDPGSAVRHASVARHVTDCATRPGSICMGKSIRIHRVKAKVFMKSGVIVYLYHFNMSGFGLHGFQG